MRTMVSGAIASCICLLLHAAGAAAEESVVDRQMALTFDDLPAQRAHALLEERISAINHNLVESLRQRGYRFIDQDTALKDPAYASEDTYTGPGGLTWLHRWAITRDVDRSLFQGEPTTASWVQEVAGIQE